MKRFLSLLIAALLLVSILPTAAAAPAGLDNFVQTREYTAGQFTDVDPVQWYAGGIRTAYEFGLVNGNSETTFNPDGSITIAETLALACRLHRIYNGGTGVFEQGAPWYQVYVDYAVDNSIIVAGKYSDYTAKATRTDFAAIMAAAFPETALPAINDVRRIPDVKKTAASAESVYLLYNAGILTGSDEFGTFNPTSNIKRSEVATIVTRMADAELRKNVTLAPQRIKAEVGGKGEEVYITWEKVEDALGYQIMCGPTAQFDPETWGQYGITDASGECKAALLDKYYADSAYWIVYAVDFNPIEGWKEDDDIGVIAQSNVVATPESMYEREELKSENYKYLAGSDFRSIRRDYSNAVAQCGYVYAFENMDGELCVLTYVGYKIISNYSQWTLHNMATGRTIVNPTDYYDRQADRAFGATKFHYMDLSSEILKHQINMLNATSNILKGGANTFSGAYVPAAELNL